MWSFQHVTRFGLLASVSVVLAGNLAACSGGSVNGDPGAAGAAGKGGTTSTGVGGGVVSAGGASAGTTSTVGGASTGGSGGFTTTGGTTSTGGTGGSAPECTNIQHPDNLDQPCSIWPEWDASKPPGEKDCDADWLTGAGYCLESCGKCQSNNTGGTGSGGSGGTGLGPDADLPDITDGTVYWASRYWDCCKPHCAWQGMPSCGADGVSNNSGDSACSGGSAYACYNEAPRAVADNLSYGYIAVPNPSCGTCYHLQFTGTGQHNQVDQGSQLIAGKHMIVKVTNTGGDVAGNQFDLMIPGGGVGINPNTCPDQWDVDGSQLGPASGGFLTACNSAGSHSAKKDCVREKCNLIPAGDARDGCLWFVDWFQVADNPNFRYTEIACPSDM